jgi:resolvase-like protein
MMTSAELIPAAVLKRKAVVYVRQSTQSQVMTNLEGRRRQYDLVDVARQHGFVDVEIIDDDLGRSASGTVARPGFDRLVAWLCAGKVGAVLCFDASRLARNGRDWHHLLELCGLVEARVIDLDGVYNPCRPNDRLLLGMKGSISEFELGCVAGEDAGCRPIESQPRRAADPGYFVIACICLSCLSPAFSDAAVTSSPHRTMPMDGQTPLSGLTHAPPRVLFSFS